jgi:hypothetical protein
MKERGAKVIKQLISPLYLLYNSNLENSKPIAYEVTTIDGINEVAELVKKQTGHVHFIDLQEFLQCKGAERITDDCTGPVGMANNTEEDSVF